VPAFTTVKHMAKSFVSVNFEVKMIKITKCRPNNVHFVIEDVVNN